MQKLSLYMGSLLLALGCGGAQPAAEAPGAPSPTPASGTAGEAPPSVAPPATFADQVALGQTLYGKNCAGCHGDGGEGKTAPRVVGLKDGALPLDPPATSKHRKAQFKTVGDVAQFVVATMPPASPGSLSEEEYLAILAFDLKANGIDLPNKLDKATASTLTIPR
jgi:mono/diheme cytochrome c family protein